MRLEISNQIGKKKIVLTDLFHSAVPILHSSDPPSDPFSVPCGAKHQSHLFIENLEGSEIVLTDQSEICVHHLVAAVFIHPLLATSCLGHVGS